MNKTGLLITVLLAAAILSTACAGLTSSPAAAESISGEIRGMSVPLDSKPILTIKTAQGQQTVQLAANTTYTLDGEACAIEDLGQILESGNTTYNCTVVIDPCEPGIIAQYMALYTIKN